MCVRSVFSDVENTAETDLVEKLSKIDSMTPLLGKWLYPKSSRVAIRLISGGKVTYKCLGGTLYSLHARWSYRRRFRSLLCVPVVCVTQLFHFQHY